MTAGRRWLYVVLVLGYAALVIPTLAPRREARRLVAFAGGKEFGRWDLTAGERRVAVPGPLGDTAAVIESGRARVVSSPCPNKICVGRGWLTRRGDEAVCVPNRVVLYLE